MPGREPEGSTSSAVRISCRSSTSDGVKVRTTAHERGLGVTSPSVTSARNASRTGTRLTPSSAARSRSTSLLPGGRWPLMISSRSCRVTRSDSGSNPLVVVMSHLRSGWYTKSKWYTIIPRSRAKGCVGQCRRANRHVAAADTSVWFTVRHLCLHDRAGRLPRSRQSTRHTQVTPGAKDATMTADRRTPFASLYSRYRAGTLTRRSFMQQALAAGMALPVALHAVQSVAAQTPIAPRPPAAPKAELAARAARSASSSGRRPQPCRSTPRSAARTTSPRLSCSSR